MSRRTGSSASRPLSALRKWLKDAWVQVVSFARWLRGGRVGLAAWEAARKPRSTVLNGPEGLESRSTPDDITGVLGGMLVGPGMALLGGPLVTPAVALFSGFSGGQAPAQPTKVLPPASSKAAAELSGAARMVRSAGLLRLNPYDDSNCGDRKL